MRPGLYISIVVILLLSHMPAKAGEIDSIRALLQQDKSDSNKVNHLVALAWKLGSNNPDTSIILAEQAFRLADEINWDIGRARAIHNGGVFYYFKGDYTTAMQYYTRAQHIWENLLRDPDPRYRNFYRLCLSREVGNMGNIYYIYGDFAKALDNYLQAMRICEELDQKKNLATWMGNVGSVYLNQKQFSKALEYFFKAVETDEKLGEKKEMATVYGNIGLIYEEEKDYAKAMEYTFRALAIDSALEDKDGISRHLGNLGLIYSSKGEHEMALHYHQEAIRLDKEIGDITGYTIDLGNIGGAYLKLRQYKEAERYILGAIRLGDSLGILNENMQFKKMAAELYTAKGDYRNALRFYRAYHRDKDSLFNQEKDKELTQHEMNFEFQKKQEEMKAEQEKKDAETAAERKRQLFFILLVSVIAVAVLTAAILILRALRATRLQKMIIEEQKDIVEQKQKEILDSIQYARRIQGSLLPTIRYIGSTLERLRK